MDEGLWVGFLAVLLPMSPFLYLTQHCSSTTCTKQHVSRSFAILRLLDRFPILLDAAAEVIKRKGDAFVSAWATVWGTCSKELKPRTDVWRAPRQ